MEVSNLGSISPRCSIVVYARHRVASTEKGVMASVGQASMHREQVPQGSARADLGGVGVSFAVETMPPSSIQLPTPGSIKSVFFPTKPSPARMACSRSSSGAVSTHGRK